MKKGKNNGFKWFLILLPVVAGGIVIYMQIKKSKSNQPGSLPGTTPSATTTPGNTGGCNFPLKKGSINNCVKQLQLALMAKYGSTILPQYGADGNWGTETDVAVLAATGQKQVNTQDDLNIIINNLYNTQGAVGGATIGNFGW